MRLDGVIDLECAQWTVPVACGAYSPRLGGHVFRHLPELVDKLLGWRGWWWSWAGGHYDMLAIATELLRRGIPAQVFMGGSRVTQIVSGDFRLVDAYALIPLALDVAAGLTGDAPPRLGWPCRCGEHCDGYCRIHERLPLDQWAELAEYCLADCKVGYNAVAFILTLCARKGYKARGTVGGTAWATARERLKLEPARWHWSTFRRARRGYHGGRVCIGRAVADHGTHYDIRSAYPAALAATAVPIGDAFELGAERAGKAYRNGVPGVYRASVSIPEMHLPPLPWRSPSGRVTYPTGRIKGSWPAPELRAAEARGVTIETIHSAVGWEEEAPIYRGFVDELYAERAAAGPDTPLGRWYRELMNSLTGKLAESPERLAIVMHPDPAKRIICDGRSARSRQSGCSVGECTGRCGRWVQIHPDGTIWGIPMYRQGGSAHVQHAAYLTAATRATWLRGAEALGEDFVYGHTDSLRARGKSSPGNEGSELGQWERKASDDWAEWLCLGPSRHRYIRCGTGEVICQSAGIARMDARKWEALRQRGGSVHDVRGVKTFKEAAAGGRTLFERRAVRHRFSPETQWRGDRILAHDGESTYAATREQIEARDRPR